MARGDDDARAATTTNSSSSAVAWSSRWLVGSSSSTHAGRRITRAASASRLRCPPDIAATGRSRSSSAETEPGGRGLGATVGVPGLVQRGPGQRLVVLLGGRRVVEAARPAARAGPPRRAAGRAPRRGRRRWWRPRGSPAPGRGSPGRRALDGAGVRRLDAGEQPQQGRLADAVLADEAERLARLGEEVDAVEDDAVAVGDREVAADERGQVRHEGHRSEECGQSGGVRSSWWGECAVPESGVSPGFRRAARRTAHGSAAGPGVITLVSGSFSSLGTSGGQRPRRAVENDAALWLPPPPPLVARAGPPERRPAALAG